MDWQSNDPLRLLLIEDNPDYAQLIESMVATEFSGSVGVTWSDRLNDGLASLAERDVDVLLLDLSLPDSDGLQTVSRLRERAVEIPIVVLTASDDEILARRAIQEGAQDYLIKGQVDSRGLLRSVRHAIERKRAETERARLLASEQLARAEAERVRQQTAAILELSPDALVVVDQAGEIVFVNRQTETLFGFRHDELIGRTVETLLPERSGDQQIQNWHDYTASPRLGPMSTGQELYGRRKDGTEFPVEISLSQMQTSDGLVTMSAVRDVTERKRAEEQIAQQAEMLRDLNQQLVITSVRLHEADEERERLLGELANERSWLRTVIDRSPIGVVLIEDPEGEHVVVNRYAEELFGSPITPNRGMDPFQKLLFSADGSLVGRAEVSYTRALAGEVITAEERLIRRSDGQTVPVLVSAGPIEYDVGNVQGAVVIFDDITALKQLERLREEWISIVTHDLRQPVTVISGYADLLAMQLPAASEAQRELEHIHTSVRSLRKLIDDLHDASQVETKHFTVTREWVEFPALVQAIVHRGAETVGEAQVKVMVEGEIPPLWVDPVRIEQVLANFLTNAAKYGNPKMPIAVQIIRRSDEVEVAVTNHGPGIAPDDLPHVFTRFYRTRAVRQRRQGGLGLGLYIAKGIVEAHGGRIGVRSIPNQTTTFKFTVPGIGKQTGAETADGDALGA